MNRVVAWAVTALLLAFLYHYRGIISLVVIITGALWGWLWLCRRFPLITSFVAGFIGGWTRR